MIWECFGNCMEFIQNKLIVLSFNLKYSLNVMTDKKKYKVEGDNSKYLIDIILFCIIFKHMGYNRIMKNPNNYIVFFLIVGTSG